MTSLRRTALFLIAALVTGLTFVTATASAASSLTLNYTCSFPLIGTQTVPITITANLPGTTRVNTAFTIVVSGSVTIPANATAGLNLVGAKTVSGTGQLQLRIVDGSTTINATVPLTSPSTSVPSSGSFTVNVSGSTSVTLTQVGTATVNAGNLSVTLTPKNASGGTTSLGTFTSSCTPNSGQNIVLGTITVTN